MELLVVPIVTKTNAKLLKNCVCEGFTGISKSVHLPGRTMDSFYIHFGVSGVDSWIFAPPLVALAVSAATSMGGISGAFLLLPFQVSILGFNTPAVSATNFVYNIVAIPSGVYRYLKEGRMAWPLTWIVIVGTLPGVLIGYYLRILYLPNPKAFKLFVGCVLLYIGARLLYELTARSQKGKQEMKALEDKFNDHVKKMKVERNAKFSAGLPADAWCRPDCELLAFSATVFGEDDG